MLIFYSGILVFCLTGQEGDRLKGLVSAQDTPTSSSLHKGGLSQRIGIRQEIEEEREGAEGKGEWVGIFVLDGTKDCLWIERRQTWPIGKWWVFCFSCFFESQLPNTECCVKMRCSVLTGPVSQVLQRRHLIAELQYLDSWTLVISLSRRKWPNRGIDLGSYLQECNLMVLARNGGRTRPARATWSSGLVSLHR